MLWEVDIYPKQGQPNRLARQVAGDAADLGLAHDLAVSAAYGYLIQGQLDRRQVAQIADELLADRVVEETVLAPVGDEILQRPPAGCDRLVHVLPKPGVMDPVAQSALAAIADFGIRAEAVRTLKKFWIGNLDGDRLALLTSKILANDAVEQVIVGPIRFERLEFGSPYHFTLVTVPVREMDDAALERLSRQGQLYLSLVEMRAIQAHFRQLGRDPTDAELETIAQTWSEHCSHKTLAGRIRYRDETGERQFQNMLQETIFAATMQIRQQAGPRDWCVSVFEDNAGVIRFDDRYNVVFKVETHNHPSALEPYGGANTGIGGVIRDPMGTGLGAKPIANTDVFCFAPPDTPFDQLPPGVLHPRRVMKGVVAGVRDYGNRMGIPTVNGAIYFDPRYLGNPLVYCGNIGLIPRELSRKEPRPGDLIVAVGGRTGRDGIHGATFSSAELTSQSETVSGGAVQIGNAITEKMLLDVLLVARDRRLYNAVTDCGAGGFSSSVGEMGKHIGAEVWLERVPLKYEGLSYTEIWISEAQERMTLSVPPEKWDELAALCASEGVEATVIGKFVPTGRLLLKYNDHQVADLDMQFLHEGQPPVVRQAVYAPAPAGPLTPISPLPLGEGQGVRALPIRKRPDLSAQQQRDQGRVCWVVKDPAGLHYFRFQEEEYAILQMLDGENSLEQIKEKFEHRFPPQKITLEELQQFCGKLQRSGLVVAGVPGSPPHPNPLPEGEGTDYDYTDDLLRILGSLNVASKEWVIRQYDHEVQGSSAVKPLVGAANDGPGDAAVLRPVLDSMRGIVVSCGMNPRYGDLDTYWMAASAIDEAVRNCVAVGADPERIAILDNFCWGNTDRPETLGSLVRAALACHDVAVALGTPFISGKDSLNNEFRPLAGGKGDSPRGAQMGTVPFSAEPISIPPSLLISALGQVDDVRRCVTMDLKEPGNYLYLVGLTRNELGGSHFALVNGLEGGQVPKVDAALAKRIFAALHKAIDAGLVRACHDLSEGGLAVAAAEMAFAGGQGARISLWEVPADEEARHAAVLLFSESNTRFLCEVRRDEADTFTSAFAGLPKALVGEVNDTGVLEILTDTMAVRADVRTLKEAWQKPLRW